MTALSKYQRLESTGLWRATPDAQRREVIVSFGDATLVLSDRNETALTHWSLAALKRINPRQRPALYSPGSDDTETLEVEDDLMISSIEKVIAAVSRQSPHPGRLRRTALVAGSAIVLSLIVFWLPGALVSHTASVVPDIARQAIGRQLLENIQRLSGKPCDNANGRRALNAMRLRLVPGMRRLIILRSGVSETGHLPGGIVLMNRALVEDFENAEVPAGFVIAEALRAENRDTLTELLRTVGLIPTFRLLTSGRIPQDALLGYAEHLLTETPPPPDRDRLLARFGSAGVSSTPYAYALDPSGETTLPLIEADPMRDRETQPVLGDSDWVSLQNICVG